MDMLELIKQRRSIRCFKQEVPPKKMILECIEAAAWAPSPTNQQPWHFIAAAGEDLKKISEVIMNIFPQRMKEIDPYTGIPDACKARKDETFAQLFAAAKEEGLDPKALFQKNLTFYGAPVAVLFLCSKMEMSLYRHATTAALQNFLLAAHAKGLGTCWLSSVVACQDEIKSLLNISDDKEILDGIALGYPVKGAPLNSFPRTRLPVQEVTTLLGFENMD
jgi:nitroreductase